MRIVVGRFATSQEPEEGLERLGSICTSSSLYSTLHNAHIEQSKFLRVVCAWTYLKKSLNVSNITYFYPNTNNPEENRKNSIFMNLKL